MNNDTNDEHKIFDDLATLQREVRKRQEFTAPAPVDESPHHAMAEKEPPQAPPAKTAQKMDRLDRLELENITAHMQNCNLQIQIIQGDLAKALARRNDLVEKMKLKRKEMQAKYGVDIAAVNVADDGTITPSQNPIHIPGM